MPWQSPYVGMDNKPIIRNDVNGDCPTCISGFIIGGLMDMAFQIGEHMFEGDDLGAAFEKVSWKQVTGQAILGGVTGFFDGGVSKFAAALADPKKRKILTKVIEFGLEYLLEEALEAGYNVSGIQSQINGLLGDSPSAPTKKLSSPELGDIGEKNALEIIKEKYNGKSVEIVEQIQGKFDDGKRTVFDFVVVDKETGSILEVVESKVNSSRFTKNQKRFYQEGENVNLFGSKFEAAKKELDLDILGDNINNKKVKSTLIKTTVDRTTGVVKSGGESLIKKVIKKL